jgi:hypothetical protein
MDKLSNKIDRLQELAATSSSENKLQLLGKVVTLRKAYKKQQELGDEFLRLIEEYATRYLYDISAEIQHQDSFLETLKEREQMAKKLHGMAVEMQSSFRVGIEGTMKKFRETGRAAFRTLIERQVLRRSIFSALSRPLPEDYDLFSEVDCVIATIKHCYIEIEIYWREETRRATIALKTHRVDPEDEEHWITIQPSLEQAITSWGVCSCSSALHSRLIKPLQTKKQGGQDIGDNESRSSSVCLFFHLSVIAFRDFYF